MKSCNFTPTIEEAMMRWLLVLTLVMAMAWCRSTVAGGLGEPLEIDPQSGAAVYRLGSDERPADDIYGEQPYSDATGRRIAIRYYPLARSPAESVSSIWKTDQTTTSCRKAAFPRVPCLG